MRIEDKLTELEERVGAIEARLPQPVVGEQTGWQYTGPLYPRVTDLDEDHAQIDFSPAARGTYDIKPTGVPTLPRAPAIRARVDLKDGENKYELAVWPGRVMDGEWSEHGSQLSPRSVASWPEHLRPRFD